MRGYNGRVIAFLHRCQRKGPHRSAQLLDARSVLCVAYRLTAKPPPCCRRLPRRAAAGGVAAPGPSSTTLEERRQSSFLACARSVRQLACLLRTPYWPPQHQCLHWCPGASAAPSALQNSRHMHVHSTLCLTILPVFQARGRGADPRQV
jgi:hypothetical protein